MPEWFQLLQQPQVGESPGHHIARILRALVGLSLKNHADQLAQLFLVNERPDRAAAVSAIKTNCGTTMREVWCLAGCKDHFVTQPYEVGMAVSWDLEAAREEGSLISLHEQPDAWKLVDEGWGLHYAIPGTNDDHMEFSLGRPDPKTGECEHAGGGREDNAITQSVGDIRWSLGRPLQHVIRPEKMATEGPAKPADPPVQEPPAITEPMAPVTQAPVTPPIGGTNEGRGAMALVAAVVAAIVAMAHGC